MSDRRYDTAGRPFPTEIRLRKDDKILDISFENGQKFSLPCELLRVESPSAEVQGHGPGQRTLVAGRRHVNIIAIEAVGNYAVRLVFDDLHDTGIFSWEYFYELGLDKDTKWQRYLDALAAQRKSRDP